MTNFKLLSAGLLATAMLTTPVLAQHYVRARHFAEAADAGVPVGAYYVGGRLCIPAPRVGAFASQPWENDIPCEPASAY